MEMEAISNKSILFSCWGRLKLKLPWLKRSGSDDRRRNKTSTKSSTTTLDCRSIAATLSVAQPKPVVDFRYDPLSYSQNFDEGSWPADGDAPSRGFTSRYAALPLPPLRHRKPPP